MPNYVERPCTWGVTEGLLSGRCADLVSGSSWRVYVQPRCPDGSISSRARCVLCVAEGAERS